MTVYQKPSIFTPFSHLIAAQSTRHGGVSPFPYASLNLGLHTKDSLENVMENRRRFFTALTIPSNQIVGAYQVHSDQILKVEQAGQYEGYDALITNQKNLFLTIKIADCVPILVYDKQQEVIAAAHAGWRGTVKRIIEKLMIKMRLHYNTKPVNCYAYIGTCIDECSFEVDEDVASEFDDAFKKWDEDKRKYLIDLKLANQTQLLDIGVPRNQIELSPFSTVLNNDDYFSYRKEKGQTGRMLAVIGMKDLQ